MGKKTIIIAWRFTPNGGEIFDTVSFDDTYEVIKFYTPTDREELVSGNCYNTLKGKLENATNLFAFIHTPNFNGDDANRNNMKEQLETFTNTDNNVFVIPFEGGTHSIYKQFLDETDEKNRTLKPEITVESIAKYFEGIEREYGNLAILEALIHLNKSLALLPLRGEWRKAFFDAEKKKLESKEEIAQKALTELSKVQYIENVDDYLKQLEPIENAIVELHTKR